MPDLSINPSSTALLVMDCQEGIVEGLPTGERPRLMTALQRAITAARGANIPVIHVLVQFRDGYPEVPPNSRFQGLKNSGRMKVGSPEAQVCKEIAPQPGDIVITKKRISAFAGSDLGVVLRGKGTNTLVLAGVSSLGVVESTARQAVDMDYQVIVLGDGCSDRDLSANQAALNILLPRIATVAGSGDFAVAASKVR